MPQVTSTGLVYDRPGTKSLFIPAAYDLQVDLVGFLPCEDLSIQANVANHFGPGKQANQRVQIILLSGQQQMCCFNHCFH
jgi:hypothetical protein